MGRKGAGCMPLRNATNAVQIFLCVDGDTEVGKLVEENPFKRAYRDRVLGKSFHRRPDMLTLRSVTLVQISFDEHHRRERLSIDTVGSLAWIATSLAVVTTTTSYYSGHCIDPSDRNERAVRCETYDSCVSLRPGAVRYRGGESTEHVILMGSWHVESHPDMCPPAQGPLPVLFSSRRDGDHRIEAHVPSASGYVLKHAETAYKLLDLAWEARAPESCLDDDKGLHGDSL